MPKRIFFRKKAGKFAVCFTFVMGYFLQMLDDTIQMCKKHKKLWF